MLERVVVAIGSCAKYSLSVFLTYALSATIGAAMVHAGSQSARSRRDDIVGRAIASDQASIDSGEPLGPAAILSSAAHPAAHRALARSSPSRRRCRRSSG